MWRNRPFFFNSSAGEPISTTRPPESRTIWSAFMTVRMRCAMMSTVLSRISPDNAACTAVSFSTSSEAVASSSKITGASFKMARAMEMRCRSPPESREPFSPIRVW